MHTKKATVITAETHTLHSPLLKRDVILSIYFPCVRIAPGKMNLLLINDGQDLEIMKFEKILSRLYSTNEIEPIFFVGIGCGIDRKNEYGTAKYLDYNGRGTKAALYQQFVFDELIPFIRGNYALPSFKEKSFCGFSLGGLSALDTVWNHPQEFSKAGVFSGSLWWRTKNLDDNYNDDTDRIMHQQIRNGKYHPGLRFYFTTGSLDETADRNKNGIIDSIDDTLDLIKELKKLGYDSEYEIKYINYQDGKHGVVGSSGDFS